MKIVGWNILLQMNFVSWLETGERKPVVKYNKHKDIILSIDTNVQMIFVTKINTDKYLEQGRIMSDYFLETTGQKKKKNFKFWGSDPNSDVSQSFWKSLIRSYKNRQSVEQDEYVLLHL